ncbi:hypothetical protein NPIL_422131 [Nephila pilipes]|uniref:Uncharacterized protein n=1 Tax=Nephila pilipes TaxID=299642 RepID=A0A8X6TFA6_NEPPI|nr:hypothetical protein NPIL_422131 [Nephila pilipes]
MHAYDNRLQISGKNRFYSNFAFPKTLVKLTQDCSSESYFTITTLIISPRAKYFAKMRLFWQIELAHLHSRLMGGGKRGGGVTPEQLGRIRIKFSRG